MRSRSVWTSMALLASAALLIAGCGGGGGGDGNANAEVKNKASAKKLSVIDISVGDFDGVALNEIIKIEFTERVQPDSVRPDTIQVREGPNFGKQVPGDFKVDGDVVYFYPSLPTKPAVPSTIGEVIYAGLKPGTVYQITLPGVPKIAVVRNYLDSPLRRQYRTRCQTAAAGSPYLYVDNFLDQLPAKVRFSNPPNGAVNVNTNSDIMLTFVRRPLNPATVSRNTVKLVMLSRHGVPNFRTVPGEPMLDQAYDRVIIRFVPDFPLADDATYRITAERLEDLVGNDVDYFQATFTVRDEPARLASFVLTYNETQKNAYEDSANSTASWNVLKTDALSALFTAGGGTGASGDLTPLAGANIQINANTAAGVDVIYEDNIFYDQFNYRRITIPLNTTVTFVQRPGGPNRPIKVLSLFPVEINGALSVRAGNGGNGETAYSTSALPTNPGGSAGPGGGNGGDAYSGASTTLPGVSSDWTARTINAANVANGGDGGKMGGESHISYSYSGGGGGGGSKGDGTAGKAGGNTWYASANGAGGALGLGRASNFARTPNVGGAGGAGGAIGYYAGLSWRTGAGSGGGGGGAITLQCAADIHVGSTGKILASGGNGGNIPQTNYYGGGGGGGGGGSVRLATTSNVLIDSSAQISVAGGTGGPFSSGSTYYTGGQGGNGGEGFICIAVPDRTNATVSQTANLTYSPPYYDTTFYPVGGGPPSVGLTKWVNLGVFDPEMIEYSPGRDIKAEAYNDSIAIEVQMVIEDPTNLGSPDLSAVDLNDSDGDGDVDDSTDLSVMSEWTPIELMTGLNGNRYQFIRIRISFQLDSMQTFNDILPFVDQLTLNFKY